MLIVFFDARGVVHFQFLPQGQTVNQHVYKEILQHLLQVVQTRRPEMWKNKSWILHHDNTPVYMPLSTWQYLAKNNIPLLEQPLYSPGLASCDIFLFLKLKEVIRRTITMKLKAIPKESFQGSIDAWKKRMEKCIRLEGDYFAGENM